ncbi:MAG: hypothetical protein U9R58_03380 [Chloroflexota bacterium]|nr:hypothetical protein [Chloroflexota bacterium]
MKIGWIEVKNWKSILTLLILLLTACNSGAVPSITKNEPLNPSEINTTKTKTCTSLSVPVPSNTPQNQTKTNIPSPTPIIVSTQTPLPTLPIEEVFTLTLDLLKTNAGCSLPCWWGITPGVTSTDEIQSFLETFLGAVRSEYRYEFSDNGGYIAMSNQPSGLQVSVYYFAENGIVTMLYIPTRMTFDITRTVYDDPQYFKIMEAYTLSQMLAVYGKPSQVLVRSFSGIAAEHFPTHFLLYYPEEGIIAQYFSHNMPVLEADKTITSWTCPSVSHLSLRLFDPDTELSLEQLLEFDDNLSKYKEISEATNMDIDTFYETYLESDCSEYIKTPEEIWPYVYDN